MFALALALRIVVPSGYMADVRGGQVTIRLCDGAGPVPMRMVMPGMDHHQSGHDHDTTSQPCAFAGATIAGLDTVAAIIVPPVVLLPMAVERAVAIVALRLAPLRLRPPGRAPPAHG